MIEVEQLVMRYGTALAVDGVDLQVDAGEIVAFLGPNGAGKTTTIEIMEGFRNRTSGSVSVLGVDPETAPREWRERIGIVLQDSEPIPELTALESVQMQSKYYRNPRSASETLELVGLADSAHVRTRKLSGGQRRRLDLALALVGDPELIFLDEPTTGFDPSARRESWAMIEALREMGRTVLLTTHYMDEAEHLADRIVVIAAGRIIAGGTAEDLAAHLDAKPVISWRPPPGFAHPPERFGFVLAGDRLRLETNDVVPLLNDLTDWAINTETELHELHVASPTLEDLYLELIAQNDSGPEIHDGAASDTGSTGAGGAS